MKTGKWYIELFDGRYKEYGGHSQWICGLIGYRLSTLSFGVSRWAIGFNRDYYDGYHNTLCIGFFYVYWKN